MDGVDEGDYGRVFPSKTERFQRHFLMCRIFFSAKKNARKIDDSKCDAFDVSGEFESKKITSRTSGLQFIWTRQAAEDGKKIFLFFNRLLFVIFFLPQNLLISEGAFSLAKKQKTSAKFALMNTTKRFI